MTHTEVELSVLVSPAAGTARAATTQDEPQADFCRPFLCDLGTKPHMHCACGLPMPLRASMCTLCRAEGLKPMRLTYADSIDEWNGRSYPSRRQRRCGSPHPDSHLHLLIAILAPAAGNEKGTRA
jgi:hypothetical protein